jgi:hypothetical protein
MARKTVRILVAAALSWLVALAAFAEPPLTTAHNLSTSTLCAEEDNVDIPISGPVGAFVIEATHPTYDVGIDNCQADFRNCPSSGGGDFVFSPGEWKLYDDGVTVVVAVRLEHWWRPNGMTFAVDDGAPVDNVHYVRIHRRIAGTSEYPEFLALYMDGSLRLIPQPPVGRPFVCYGSSVLIGPAVNDPRPIAEIASARYLSATQTLELTYRSGGTARLDVSEVDRAHAKVTVHAGYPTGEQQPFATLRSMYVTDGNADVDHVRFLDEAGTEETEPILGFTEATGRDWFFHRVTRSAHNTSAPDITVRALAESCSDDTALCLLGGRFRLTATWETSDGQHGTGRTRQLTDETGYFWFFAENNVEVVVKVLDACGPFGRFWVFAAGLTNVAVDLRVEDTLTGAVRTYSNPLGKPFQPLQDTNAFATCP